MAVGSALTGETEGEKDSPTLVGATVDGDGGVGVDVRPIGELVGADDAPTSVGANVVGGTVEPVAGAAVGTNVLGTHDSLSTLPETMPTGL